MVKQLLKFQDLLHVANFIFDGFRMMGFAVLNMLGALVDALSGASKETYKLMSFYNYKQVRELVAAYKPVIVALATLALIYYGWKLIMKPKMDRHQAIDNLILGLTIFILLPWGLKQGVALVNAGTDLLNSERSASTTMFKNNITDLYTVDQAGWKSTKTQNDIKTKRDVKSIDITEKMDTGWGLFTKSPLSKTGKKLLSKQLNYVNGTYQAANMKSFWKIGDPAYYRYSWHPFFILIDLATKAIVYGFVIFKSARLMNELGLLYMITEGVALTDIESGQRNKQLVTTIRDTLVVLYLLVFLIHAFDLWGAFVADTQMSKYVKPFCLAAGAWLVIDGPNFIERQFGVDAGLSSVGRTMTAAAQTMAIRKGSGGGGGLGGSLKTKASSVKNAAGRAGRGGMYTGAALKGALDGFSSQGADSGGPMPQGHADGKKKSEPSSNTPSPLEGNSEASKKGATENAQGAASSSGKPETGKEPGADPSPSLPGGGKAGPTFPEGFSQGGASDPSSKLPSAKVPEAVKSMSKGNGPLNDPKKQQAKNKEQLARMGGSKKNPLAGLHPHLKAQETLNGGKQAAPTLNGAVPSHVQTARSHLMASLQPREVDKETIGDKAINKYADMAQQIHDGPTMRRTRKVYDVSKATSKRIKDHL